MIHVFHVASDPASVYIERTLIENLLFVSTQNNITLDHTPNAAQLSELIRRVDGMDQYDIYSTCPGQVPLIGSLSPGQHAP